MGILKESRAKLQLLVGRRNYVNYKSDVSFLMFLLSLGLPLGLCSTSLHPVLPVAMHLRQGRILSQRKWDRLQ